MSTAFLFTFFQCLSFSHLYTRIHLIFISQPQSNLSTTTERKMRYLLQTLVINCKFVLIEYFPRNFMISFCVNMCTSYLNVFWYTDRLSTSYKYNVSVNNATLYFIYNKNSIFSGRHISTLLGHLQALWENRSKSYLYLNALWDPKCTEI